MQLVLFFTGINFIDIPQLNQRFFRFSVAHKFLPIGPGISTVLSVAAVREPGLCTALDGYVQIKAPKSKTPIIETACSCFHVFVSMEL